MLIVCIDKNMYGPDADQFLPERWLRENYDVPAPYQFAFGAGARMCTAVNFSNRVLYGLFVRLIVSFKITGSKDMPANTDHLDYKLDPAASNALPKDFKVKFTPRDQGALEACLKQCHDGLTEFVTGDNAEPLFR